MAVIQTFKHQVGLGVCNHGVALSDLLVQTHMRRHREKAPPGPGFENRGCLARPVHPPQGGLAGWEEKSHRKKKTPFKKKIPGLRQGGGWIPFWYPPPGGWAGKAPPSILTLPMYTKRFFPFVITISKRQSRLFFRGACWKLLTSN